MTRKSAQTSPPKSAIRQLRDAGARVTKLPGHAPKDGTWRYEIDLRSTKAGKRLTKQLATLNKARTEPVRLGHGPATAIVYTTSADSASSALLALLRILTRRPTHEDILEAAAAALHEAAYRRGSADSVDFLTDALELALRALGLKVPDVA